jgi:hypothetical protein
VWRGALLGVPQLSSVPRPGRTPRRAQFGGAMYLASTSATLSGCTFTECAATASGDGAFAQGGAMYIFGLESSPARLSLAGCTIRGSLVSGTSAGTHGAGLYIIGAHVLLSNTTITNSSASPARLLRWRDPVPRPRSPSHCVRQDELPRRCRPRRAR